MSNRKYSPEFRADAVRLYESRPDMSYSDVAADLGIARGTIKTWVFQARKVAGKVATAAPEGVMESPEEELSRLRVENADLREREKMLKAENDKLDEERAILRKATKYFAAETTW